MKLWISLALAAIVLAADLLAQCPTITFDDLAVGTRVSNQYAGVTFSGRWGVGSGPLPVIYNPAGSTSSEPQCLSVWGDGAGEFSEDFLRLDFARDQTEVTFTLGVRVGCSADDRVTVRLYDASAVLRQTLSVPVNGAGPAETVNVVVHASRADAGPFRRVEIEAGLAGGCAARFELIDDLLFNLDATPPVAAISTPSALSCVCYGGAITGSAYDPDGSITSWRLERQAVGAASWTLIALSTTEVIDDTLANWYPASSATEGYYILRLTVTNSCGVATDANTVVWLDRALTTLTLRSPTDGAILGGTVCADGTMWDHCSGTMAVEHRPVLGTFTSFDSVPAPWVINDPLGTWNTRGGTPDGTYEVRISAADGCGNPASASVQVVIDNTPPTAVITSPLACSPIDGRVTIRGTVNDANLAGWTLEYVGGSAHTWQPIASGTGRIINGVLASWNAGSLDACCYVLRLVAIDSAILDCDVGVHNRTEYLVAVNADDCAADIDGDGDVDLIDLANLLSVYGTTCP